MNLDSAFVRKNKCWKCYCGFAGGFSVSSKVESQRMDSVFDYHFLTVPWMAIS